MPGFMAKAREMAMLSNVLLTHYSQLSLNTCKLMCHMRGSLVHYEMPLAKSSDIQVLSWENETSSRTPLVLMQCYHFICEVSDQFRELR